jgi:hypothetical protein
MYPVTIQTISAERGREMRQQAAAWRRAREARNAARARPTLIPFALIARNARSLAGRQRLQRPRAVA